ncbi:hypothetical protein RclHR1_23910001 [Rhizophagus clarus]|uniref:Uncharacterized protein n=1 Tax=Rhizophagus clarus TaxID=94130 RepID=A0A2Z6RAA7_9GLOM|nr:hypothetical protein RclHR1_23910001 [Rhizophagus clarus]
MGEKIDKYFCDTFHNSSNRNTIQDCGHYGKPTFLPTGSNGDVLGRSIPLVGTLYNKDGFRGGDELSRQVKLPYQNARQFNRQNYYDGCKLLQLPINGEFDDFGRRREDYTNHVQSISPQWENNVSDTNNQRVNSDRESKQNTSTPIVHPECLARIRGLSIQLVPLLRVNTPEGNARKKEPCHLVLPDDRPKISSFKDDASICQVSVSDGYDEENGYSSNSSVVIDTITKFNRCHIANSTGFKLYDKDQEDYISYIKEKLIGYIEEVERYGFDHIIVIGELNYSLLFLDCFGRMFYLDSLTSELFLLGDCSKRMERVTKGLMTDEWVPWIVDADGGNVVEIKGMCKFVHFKNFYFL